MICKKCGKTFECTKLYINGDHPLSCNKRDSCICYEDLIKIHRGNYYNPSNLSSIRKTYKMIIGVCYRDQISFDRYFRDLSKYIVMERL